MTPRRIRQRRNRALVAAAVGLLVCLVAAAALFLAVRFETLTVAVGPSGSNDAKIVEEMARAFARDRGAIRLTPLITDSAEAAAKLFQEGNSDLAIMRSDELAPQAKAVAILRKNALVLWTPGRRAAGKGGSPKIDKVQALSGRKIGLLGRAPANRALLKAALEASGASVDKTIIEVFASSDIDAMAADNTLAAYATIGPSDSKLTSSAVSATVRTRGEPAFLAVDAADALIKKMPQYESVEIPASSFSSSPSRPDEAIQTIGVNHLIVARQTLSEESGAYLARQIFNNRQSLLKDLPGIATLEKPDTDKDSAIPVHPGAAAFIDGTERTFLEKYSDYMWGALLLLSGVGSGFASVRAFFKRDEIAEHLKLRDELLALAAKARSETSFQGLIKLEEVADQILKSTINLHDDGALSDGELSAFGLILEHFRDVVTEQKRAATDNLARPVRSGQAASGAQ